MMEKKTALVAGSTGLIGNQLLNFLLEDSYYDHVISVARRKLPIDNDKLTQVVTDFLGVENVKRQLKADDVFCCLGTTMKKAGSKEKFYEVDFEYPVALGGIAKENGASQYLLVSAMGAKKTSSIFYNKVKGEVEEAIEKIGFATTHIMQPSLLLGDRGEERVGEDAAKNLYKALGFLFIGPLKKYKAIASVKVARAMQQLAKDPQKGVHRHESGVLQNY